MPKGYEVARIDAKPGRLRTSLPKGARIVALDERGKDYTTVQFSKLLGEETAFVIGGPDGLDDATRKEARVLLRLSSLTLPHALAQLVLIEQLYRAATLLTGHPYHRS
jgi:23S rRNA (pseudouridine1915-N3)-methyltransferase